LKSGAKHVLLFGGSRSGKTTVLVMAIIYRMLRFASNRYLICRYRAMDARSSVLRETLLPWLDKIVGKGGYIYLAHENMVTLYNGSEIWIGGLGDREQTGQTTPLFTLSGITRWTDTKQSGAYRAEPFPKTRSYLLFLSLLMDRPCNRTKNETAERKVHIPGYNETGQEVRPGIILLTLYYRLTGFSKFPSAVQFRRSVLLL
jgi:hypothetical protein